MDDLVKFNDGNHNTRYEFEWKLNAFAAVYYVHPERMQDYLIQRRDGEYKHRLSR